MFGFFKKTLTLMAPITGETVNLTSVPDEAFSKKMVGDGIAIKPTGDTVVSPCDGVLSLIMETKHAFAITLDNGVEILVHVGVDTVHLNGAGFTILAEVGQAVKAGTPIIKLDKIALEAAGINLITPVLIANVDYVKEIKGLAGKNVIAGEDVVVEYKL